jgi:hypothetical protein
MLVPVANCSRLCADLSNVEYMPAYLNKRLNNRLWSRRKTQQQQQQQQAVSLVAAQHLVGL